MFIDEASLIVKAGDGGDGVISFRREKFIARGGPDGGHGGHGGHVYLEADKNTATLHHFMHQRHYRAEKGKAGSGGRKTGKSGQDLVLKVPPGTIIFQQESGHETGNKLEDQLASHHFLCDLDKDGERFLVAKGGRGGKGNSSFAHSLNQSPRLAEIGEKGEEKQLFLELKVLADVGLVGFPNAGKSTLLGKISRTDPKIGDYPFTTLYPQLGIHQIPLKAPFTVADIPGIIEGASEGKGLGIRFLKHIERCRMLLFLLDLDQEHIDLIKDQLETLFKEVTYYHPRIKEKIWVIGGNKIDTLRGQSNKDRMEDWFKKLSHPFFFISGKEGIALDSLMLFLSEQLEMLPSVPLETRDYALYTLDEQPVKIEKLDEHLYQVHCNELERIISASDLHHPGSLRYINRLFKKYQLEKLLRQHGLQKGDMVEISGKRLHWT